MNRDSVSQGMIESLDLKTTVFHNVIELGV